MIEAYNPTGWPTVYDLDKRHEIIEKRITSIIIASYPIVHVFYCFDCRMPMFSYQGEIVKMDAGSVPMKLPVEIMCRNPQCKRVVRLEYIVVDYQ